MVLNEHQMIYDDYINSMGHWSLLSSNGQWVKQKHRQKQQQQNHSSNQSSSFCWYRLTNNNNKESPDTLLLKAKFNDSNYLNSDHYHYQQPLSQQYPIIHCHHNFQLSRCSNNILMPLLLQQFPVNHNNLPSKNHKQITTNLSCSKRKQPSGYIDLMAKILHLLILFQLVLFSNCSDSFDDLDEQIPTSLCHQHANNALGMESGAIPDHAITASSSYNEQSVGPQNARLNRDTNGGAWCPSSQINNENSGHEWIQINLTQPHVITKIATQGRFANNVGKEFAETFWLNYTRDDGKTWSRWQDQYGEYDIPGNVDTYSIVENVLFIPLVGVTAIRLLPVSMNIRTCCVRLELYGCLYKDGPISYSMMDGQSNSRFGDLTDNTYDGQRSLDGFLSEGLGQLVDGIKGDDNYKVNKGFEWIGWEANANPELEIQFQFQDIRNFTMAFFHCHNLFTKHVQVFSSARIWFSLDGHQWSSEPEYFEYMSDMELEQARDVVIHLHHHIARFIKFKFSFQSKWILISEASFESTPVNNSAFTLDDLGLISHHHHHQKNMYGPIITSPILQQNKSVSIYNEPMVLIIFFSVAILLILFVAMLVCLARKRKEKITGNEYCTVPMKDSSPTPLYCEPHDFNLRTTLAPFRTAINNGVVVGNGSSLIGLTNVNAGDPEYAVPDLINNGNGIGSRNAFLTTGDIGKPNGNLLNSLTLGGVQPLPISFSNKIINDNNWKIKKNDNIKNNDNDDDDGKARYYASADVLSRNNDHLENHGDRPINSTGFYIPSANTNRNNPLFSQVIAPVSFQPITNGVYNAAILNESPPSSLSSNNSKILRLNNNINSSTPSTSLESYENNTSTTMHSNSHHLSPVVNFNTNSITNGSTPSPMMMVSTEQIKVPLLKEKELSIIDNRFGYSKFGDCELGYLNRKNGKKKLVILKTIVASGNRQKFLEEFQQEMNEKYRLSQTCLDSFAKMYGYISKYDYTAMVIEYGDCDLKKFLKNSSPSVVRTSDLIEIAYQVAQAMQDLHRRGFIHRDLAARNCLIYTKNLRVKITDSGALIKDYKNEYFNDSLPLRWLSYESITQGLFTKKSDVFSFGVCLWEIMKYCQSLPHQPLSDQELLAEILEEENSIKDCDRTSAYYNHPFSDETNQMNGIKTILRLQKPKDCPDEIDDLIQECTQRCVESRPDFSEIIYFLKNLKDLNSCKNSSLH